MGKEVIEAKFETLLKTLQPTKPLFDLAAEIFKDVCNSRVKQVKSHIQHFEAAFKKLEEKVELFLKRAVQADSPTLIKTYEDKIKTIEAEKVLVREKSQATDVQKDHLMKPLEPLISPNLLR